MMKGLFCNESKSNSLGRRKEGKKKIENKIKLRTTD